MEYEGVEVATLDEFRRFVIAKAKPLSIEWQKAHVGFGIGEETLEVVEEVKRFAYKDFYSQPDLQKELGDLFWYIVLGCVVYGVEVPDFFLKANFTALNDYEYKANTKITRPIYDLIDALESEAKSFVGRSKKVLCLGKAEVLDDTQNNLYWLLVATMRLCYVFSCPVDQTITLNMQKLTERHPNGFSEAYLKAS